VRRGVPGRCDPAPETLNVGDDDPFKPDGGWIVIARAVQLIASLCARDSGPNADPDDTGYRRLILAAGVQLVTGKWRLDGDVEIPVAQSYNGAQLAAPALFKAILSREF
jgi:hypothetical protein